MNCPYSKFQRLPDRVNHTWIQQRQKTSGFVQEKKNVKTHLLSHQPPSNEFGADSKSSLK